MLRVLNGELLEVAARRALDAEVEPAILLTPDYRIVGANLPYRRRFGEVKGGHCYRVSHGYDSPCSEHGELCPLQACQRSERTARVLHVHHAPEGPEHVDIEMRPVFAEDGTIAGFLEVLRPVRVETVRGTDVPLIGRSRAFARTVELVQRVSPSPIPVLLLGETGTGKELVASAIHRSSPYGDGPFVPVECTGLPEGLFESELFGHERGAFTGADRSRPGLVEAADGGTLFLDEIGDVPLSMQVKLLRLLESGMYRPVGGMESKVARFRLICATHRDVQAMVRAGAFREDLYFRISAFPVRLPPLRERRDDIPLLADAILDGSGKTLGSSALAALQAHDLPGNVRQLRNLLERAVILADGPEILVEHLADPAALPASEGPPPPELIPLAEAEQRYLTWAVATFDGDRRALAERLGISERTLYRKLASGEDRGAQRSKIAKHASST